MTEMSETQNSALDPNEWSENEAEVDEISPLVDGPTLVLNEDGFLFEEKMAGSDHMVNGFPVSGGRTKKHRKRKKLLPSFGHHHHNWSDREKEKMKIFESTDYDDIENSVWERASRLKSDWKIRAEDIARWIIIILIGFFTGSTAALIDVCVRSLASLKFKWTLHFIGWKSLSGTLYGQLLFCGSSVLMVGFSGMLVAYFEPMAAGSGIPEIKAYLNGNKLPRLLRLKTVICKVIGVIFAVAGGLYLGKEGPLVHTGAIVAAGISQGGKFFRLHTFLWKAFLNDHDKRDFVAAGAAAGVSAAFGAPIGGILFALEEASSFWNVSLTWRAFACSMISTFTLKFWLSGATGRLNAPGLITFGKFVAAGYKLWEVPFFVGIAFFGGIYGALFNSINARICKGRIRWVNRHRWLRLIEVCLIGFGTSFCAFWAPFPFECNKLSDIDGYVNATQHGTYVQYRCPEGEYNDMATTIFATQEEAIHHFFHNAAEFSIPCLIVFAVIYFFWAVVTYGVAVPSGLFVPCILSGCSFGRLVGQLLCQLFPNHGIDAGTYALIGAAAMLGGVARMTVSLTVILLETTNDIQFLLPIMLTLQVAKWVGDLFNPSLYDIHVTLKCIPFLEHEPDAAMRKLCARDIMAVDVICVREIESVAVIVKLLKATTHNGFPVIEQTELGQLGPRRVYRGMILRSQLVILLKHKVFREPPDEDTSLIGEYVEDARDPHLSMLDFATIMDSRVPRIQQVEASLTEHDMLCCIDLKPYMSPYPYIVYRNFPVPRVFRLFRTMGLRHMVVVDRHNQVSGIITRKDLLFAPEKLRKKYDDETESVQIIV